ncbi:MAG: FadR/GntR family transcriptional regulator [Aminivibrio sp.]|uniref:FadR/GntR family transcriptional regulator n=1 Tax=Aminivibrio sp. TaxID=1872489 RepID=UPI002B211E2A|nr:FadR/GntR family transcriptional regulator [Aminivibrio sp.]MEA4952589.1 FadR/GntR family transcriptional regulator [Aminivibrio sp.]
MDVIPFQRKNRSDVIFEKLQELIGDGQWKPGDRFPTEMELTRLFNVGRSTVREALNHLKTSNLIQVVPGRGTFVTEPLGVEHQILSRHIPDSATAQELFNIIEFRICIEPSTAYLAAERISGPQKKRLLSIAGAVDNEELSPAEFAETDIAFHIFLAEITGNPLCVEIMNYLHTFFYKQQIVTSLISARKKAAAQSHIAIAKAVAAHNAKTAEKEMRAHLCNTREYLESIVRETALPEISKNQSGGGS